MVTEDQVFSLTIQSTRIIDFLLTSKFSLYIQSAHCKKHLRSIHSLSGLWIDRRTADDRALLGLKEKSCLTSTF